MMLQIWITILGLTFAPVKQPLNEWLFDAAVYFAPPHKQPKFPEYEETEEEVRSRYQSIANDIAHVIHEGKGTRSEAALMLGWAIGETYLSKDADIGPCYQEGSWKKRCDGGLAAGIWQMHQFTSKEDGVMTPERIFADRRRAAKYVLKYMRASWSKCGKMEKQDRMSQFGLGFCKEGNVEVRRRFHLGRKIEGWVKHSP